MHAAWVRLQQGLTCDCLQVLDIEHKLLEEIFPRHVLEV